jgi:hypothetical protein
MHGLSRMAANTLICFAGFFAGFIGDPQIQLSESFFGGKT